MCTWYSEDPGILLTDISCAYLSVDHKWIFMVLERAGVAVFPLGTYADSTRHVEHAGAARRQLAMMRGVRQCCPASGYLWTKSFDSVFRWLLSCAFPPEPCRPWFLEQCACAYADDFALATASLREALPIVATAFATIDQVTGMSLDYQKSHWIHYGNMTGTQFVEWVGTHFPDFQPVQISDHAKYLCVVIGPGTPAHRCSKAKNTVHVACSLIRASSQSLVSRVVSFKIYALSVLGFVGLVCEPDKETVTAEHLALQRLSAGRFDALPPAMLRRGSTCGLKIDVDGIQLTS